MIESNTLQYSYRKTPNHQRKWQFHCSLVTVTVVLSSLLAGCTSLGDLLSRSSRLGIPLRDLLRLVPVLLGSAAGPQTLPGFPLQAYWSRCSALVNWLVTSHRRSSQPYVPTASTGRTDGWFLPVTPAGVHIIMGQDVTVRRLASYCLTATRLPLRRNVWNIQTFSFSASRKWNN